MTDTNALIARRDQFIAKRDLVDQRMKRDMVQFTDLSLKIGDLNARITIAKAGQPITKGRPGRSAPGVKRKRSKGRAGKTAPRVPGAPKGRAS